MVIAIDPGPEESALLVLVGNTITHAMYDDNDAIVDWLYKERDLCGIGTGRHKFPLVIEKIASFGMPVGAEVFETVYWSGRFAEAYGAKYVSRITRIEVKNHICHSARAKDGNVRQALIDRFGPVGTKKKPGPLYGISGDLWSALAVAVTWADQNKPEV